MEIARGVFPVLFTWVTKIGPEMNGMPVTMLFRSNTVNVLAEEFVTHSTLAAWKPPVWLARPPGLRVLISATGSDVRELMITTSLDWNDWTYTNVWHELPFVRASTEISFGSNCSPSSRWLIVSSTPNRSPADQ